VSISLWDDLRPFPADRWWTIAGRWCLIGIQIPLAAALLALDAIAWLLSKAAVCLRDLQHGRALTPRAEGREP
jgi:hypothetical protein